MNLSDLLTPNTITPAYYSGNGSTVIFTLPLAPGSVNNMQVNIGGVVQYKTSYSVSGTTLTFSQAPPTGTNNIEVLVGSIKALNVIDDGSVTTAKLAPSLALAGVPTAPTAAAGTNTAQVATTANVYSSAVGFGQTWQTVTPSRVSGTTYYNTTAKPIIVTVYSTSAASTAGSVTIYTDGISTDYNYMPAQASGTQSVTRCSVVVPAGMSYSAVIVGTPIWKELR